MATRTQTKADLATSAAKLTVVSNGSGEATAPSTGDNQPPTWDMNHIAALAIQAFKDDDEGNQKKGTGQQRMTAAVLALWGRWADDDFEVFSDDDDGTPSLDGAFRSPKVRQQILTQVRKVLLPMDDTKKSDDEKAQYDASRASHGSLINVAVKVAAILHGKGITHASFEEKPGMFRIPPDVLLPKDTHWRGTLANDTTPLLLNQRTFSAYRNEGEGDEKKEVAVKIKLSVLSILNAARSFQPKKKDDKETKANNPLGDEQVGKPEDTALTMGWLIRALYAKTHKGFDYKNPISVNGWVRSEEWSQLTDVSDWSGFVQGMKSFDKMAQDKQSAK